MLSAVEASGTPAKNRGTFLRVGIRTVVNPLTIAKPHPSSRRAAEAGDEGAGEEDNTGRKRDGEGLSHAAISGRFRVEFHGHFSFGLKLKHALELKSGTLPGHDDANGMNLDRGRLLLRKHPFRQTA